MKSLFHFYAAIECVNREVHMGPKSNAKNSIEIFYRFVESALKKKKKLNFPLILFLAGSVYHY